MKVDKGSKTTAANEKLANGKLSLASTKLVQEKLAPGSPKARSLKNSSDQDYNNVRLLLVRANKGPKTSAVNEKLASNKLSLALTL